MIDHGMPIGQDSKNDKMNKNTQSNPESVS